VFSRLRRCFFSFPFSFVPLLFTLFLLLFFCIFSVRKGPDNSACKAFKEGGWVLEYLFIFLFLYFIHFFIFGSYTEYDGT